MPSYKLLYFNLRGRAELARLMFAEAGVEYEDKRIHGEDWPAIKPEMPFGQVPILYVDEKPLAQSGAIIRYLAREFNLAGETSLEQAHVDMFYETVLEAFVKLRISEQDPEKKKEMILNVLSTNIYPLLEKLEKQFKESKSGYIVGKSLTYVDIGFLQVADMLNMIDVSIIDKFPELKASVQRVLARPRIKKWIEIRPETEM